MECSRMRGRRCGTNPGFRFASSGLRAEETHMVIASRILKLRRQGGEIEIPIRVFKPEEGEKDFWQCTYEIEWPDRKRTMKAAGVDSVQALLLALQLIGTELYTSNFHKSGDLYFDTPGP